jgi:hypothetical protein
MEITSSCAALLLCWFLPAPPPLPLWFGLDCRCFWLFAGLAAVEVAVGEI